MSNVKTQFIVRACGLLRHLYIPTRAWLIYTDMSGDDIRGLWFYGLDRAFVYIVYTDRDNQLRTYSLAGTHIYDEYHLDALVRYAERLRRYAYADLYNNESVKWYEKTR